MPITRAVPYLLSSWKASPIGYAISFVTYNQLAFALEASVEVCGRVLQTNPMLLSCAVVHMNPPRPLDCDLNSEMCCLRYPGTSGQPKTSLWVSGRCQEGNEDADAKVQEVCRQMRDAAGAIQELQCGLEAATSAQAEGQAAISASLERLQEGVEKRAKSLGHLKRKIESLEEHHVGVTEAVQVFRNQCAQEMHQVRRTPSESRVTNRIVNMR